MDETATDLTVEQKAHALGDELRSIAAFFETNPEIAARTYDICDTSIQAYAASRNDLVALARALKDATGRCNKRDMGPYFKVEASFGRLRVWGAVDREKVCRKVVKGTKVLPPVPAMPARTVEDVEWVCEPLLGEKA